MSYLTVEEYLDRFTEAETIRITDRAKTGQYDADTVETAIADAVEYADSFLAGRYTLPIETPPALLKRLVADLARENLHGTRPTDAVTKNADKARALLSALSSGKASIPAPPAGTAPAENPSDSGAVANDRRARVFSDETLDDFTAFVPRRFGGTVFDGPGSY